MKAQSDMMSDIMASDIERAKRIATGREEVPAGLNGITAWKAMEIYAMENNDGQLALDLANSPIASENSMSGQTLSLTRGRDVDTATAKLQEIKKLKEKIAEKKHKGKTKSAVENDIKAELSKRIKKEQSSPKNFETFLKEIRC